MLKKILYVIFTLAIAIAVNAIVAINGKFNWVVTCLCAVAYVIATVGLFLPDKLFKITHWYLGCDLGNCNPVYATFFRVMLPVMMFLSATLPIYLMAPIQL